MQLTCGQPLDLRRESDRVVRVRRLNPGLKVGFQDAPQERTGGRVVNPDADENITDPVCGRRRPN